MQYYRRTLEVFYFLCYNGYNREKNGVYYYPILAKKEEESWKEFIATAFEKLLIDGYGGAYQKRKIEAFKKNLGA